MAPTPDLIHPLVDEVDLQKAQEAVVEALKEGKSVPDEAFDGEGYTAVERIKLGMKVEVMSQDEPLCGWVATVVDNVGGRLLLRYDTPDCSASAFWMFYLNTRLRPPDWIHQQGPPWRYKHMESSGQYEEAEWAALLEMSRDDARRSPLPTAIIKPTPSQPHQLTQDMWVEAVHPTNPNNICVAKISRIIAGTNYFEVTLVSGVSQDDLKWVTSSDDPRILPVGFCKNHNIRIVPPRDWAANIPFTWDAITSLDSQVYAEHNMVPRPELAEDLGFEAGQRLEALNPKNRNQISVATIRKISGHLLHITLDCETNPSPIFVASTSLDIFPTGWCQSNSYPLQIPSEYSPLTRASEDSSQARHEDDEEVSGSNQPSLWCPRLYVNHWCYTGPYLSKSKVAKQSQSVGPGSVELVLREVLAMTINAAYIPTRVLRELERSASEFALTGISSAWHPTPFKAKFKRYNYTANLPVATTASEVCDFLHFICQTLQCCPNLWSHMQTGENCPLLCTSQVLIQGSQSSSSRGRGRIAMSRGIRGGTGMTRIFHRRKRGGRKRLFVPVRANRLLQTKTQSDDITEDGEEEEDVEIDEGEDEEMGSASDGDTSSRSSRPTSPLLDSALGNRKRRRGFSRMEQTRGMKLPEDYNQFKPRHIRGGEGSSSTSSYREDSFERTKRGRKSEPTEGSSGLEPACVTSDPLEWTVHDVEQYVANQPTICHHAVKLREQEVDGRAFLLLNLPTLVQHLGLPHSSAVAVAQHVCRVKLAHFMYFYRAEA